MVADIGDLRAFCLVVDRRSLTAAAEILGESKATVSRRIARLEQSLDVALLRRSPRLVEPTEDGVAYRLRVGEILELLGDANTAVRGSRAAPSGRLRVTAPPEFGSVLAPHIAAFNKRYPAVLLDLLIAQKILDFETEHLDLAFRVAAKLPDSPLIAHKLFDLEALGVASPDYLREHRPPKKPADLEKHRIIHMSTICSQHPLPFRRVDGTGPIIELRAHPAIAASDLNFVKELAVAGAGICFMPALSVRRELDEGRLVPVLRQYVLCGAALYLLHNGGRFLPPKVRAFRDYILDAFDAKGRRLNGSAPMVAATA
ncbi:LysR family transcriptional regulator [Pendulispora albinea]|uniref:LysR family transcriptional regulator n=1 Tax=Pendulispora albinea TaxID=2741071 RepID=A0ABZ2LKR4_9BACT